MQKPAKDISYPKYLFHQGKNTRCHEFLGARPAKAGGRPGYIFRVWAPRAKGISIVGDFNGWDP